LYFVRTRKLSGVFVRFRLRHFSAMNNFSRFEEKRLNELKKEIINQEQKRYINYLEDKLKHEL
jgi:hypothetical protein